VSGPSPFQERRFGRFVVSNDLLDEAGWLIAQLFVDLVVVRAEQRVEFDGIEFVCAGWCFDPVPRGQLAPLYAPTCRTITIRDPVNDDNVAMPPVIDKWVKLSP
jgi:hypothetical protein